MRRRILLLPGGLDVAGESPLADILGEPFRNMLGKSGIVRTAGVPSDLPELEWIGLEPGSLEISAGVLAVSALGADPPDRSVHFHLSVLSVTDDEVRVLPYMLAEQESAQLTAIAMRLETSRLKFVGGNDVDHGLVWEDGSIELSAPSPDSAVRDGFRDSLPCGDGEPLLRRFIDDSVNLLSELEWNRRREEDGLPPFNLLWPWGPGFRPRLPNLPLARGKNVRWESPSPRLLGLARLAGYRHGDPWTLGLGTNLRLDVMKEAMLAEGDAIAVVPNLGEFRRRDRADEVEWFGREIGKRLLAPLIEDARVAKSRFVLVATDRNGEGLALSFPGSENEVRTDFPFGAESVQEAGLPRISLHGFMAKELSN